MNINASYRHVGKPVCDLLHSLAKPDLVSIVARGTNVSPEHREYIVRKANLGVAYPRHRAEPAAK